jgi:L-lactate utilization protein LutC
MTADRDAFLQRVRQAVVDGNRAGTAPQLPVRGGVGYQGGGDDLIQRFREQLTAVGSVAQIVADASAAGACVLEIVQAKAARRILLGRGFVLDTLLLAEHLRERGLEVAVIDALPPGGERDAFFRADLGITGVTWAIAETGTLVMAAAPREPRSVSLLPPVHVAVVGRDQILPDLFDLFADLETDKSNLPSCLSLITGPSKTGDIELKLVTGVHGPGELHVVLIR